MQPIASQFPEGVIALDPTIQLQLEILGGFIVLLWVLETVDQLLLRNRLNALGIRPCTQIGLRGILFAPLLHGSWAHLAANTVPFLVLGWLVLLNGFNQFAIVTAVVWIVSGLGVWLFASRNSLHIGASGVVFGYLGFLLARGYFRQDFGSIAIAVVVLALYGPLIWGILPFRRGISWQGHLFGMVGGVLAARYMPQLQQGFATIERMLQR
ncbi:rhomboid family intramembrane serine protease [Leptolyngbya sp. FACHB-711]|uniref:rhomboid family intramembrane serine protease n=1 Tax=unclassified Leptolyngbya TaxID=2650499 RepID=UPI001684F538|nr:rhomboid family intramembrane serine protease [Leptolyngbya sp. FACHB-711]MBD1850849.1 rhomboid family intramembrane serine protease [Cyanobacteria bacterium FACHB-502]MBD2023928.1 rhomboid family intramembrane serine protease [Leptolyngbya sp. FACHB-711]